MLTKVPSPVCCAAAIESTFQNESLSGSLAPLMPEPEEFPADETQKSRRLKKPLLDQERRLTDERHRSQGFLMNAHRVSLTCRIDGAQGSDG